MTGTGVKPNDTANRAADLYNVKYYLSVQLLTVARDAATDWKKAKFVRCSLYVAVIVILV